jgi:release factor glutamine methyltransferase
MRRQAGNVAMAEAWTVLRLLTWTTQYLAAHGATSPRLDAEVLLAHARGCDRIALYTAFDEVVADEVRSRFRELVRQRASGTPVAYLVGQREFFSLSLKVTPAVLIPRPETEFVVLAAIDALKTWPAAEMPLWAADVGTGSGAIAIAIARHVPHVRLVALDRSPEALAVAAENVAAHHLGDRITLLESDLLAAVPPQRQLAVVASNPPYVSQEELEKLPPEVRDHEPHLALCGGPTGTEVIQRLVPQAAERLVAGGWLILEVSPMIASRVVALLQADGRFEQVALRKDLAQLVRIVTARRSP